MIPLVDLKAQYLEIKDELEAALKETLADGRFILGPNVGELEKEIAAYCGAAFGVGVASGTDALHLALLALGIGPGDEVITTPFTFIATAEAISYTGATPVFVDIDPSTYNLDVEQIESRISPRTRAVLPVHLYGQPADMERIRAIAAKYKLAVVEDCAQAIGAEYKGERVGSIGDAGCFSFFPSKNLGGAGDGGMVVTNDERLAARIKRLRAHGSSRKYYHEEIGYNSRLDEIQAAIIRVKLRRLDKWTADRQAAAAKYSELLNDDGLLNTPITAPDRTHVWHQYTIRLAEREAVRAELSRLGIATGVHYPLPIHRQPAYKTLDIDDIGYAESEKAAAEVLSLPIYPQLKEDDIRIVCGALIDLAQKDRGSAERSRLR